jgi:hypothetical protein
VQLQLVCDGKGLRAGHESVDRVVTTNSSAPCSAEHEGHGIRADSILRVLETIVQSRKKVPSMARRVAPIWRKACLKRINLHVAEKQGELPITSN